MSSQLIIWEGIKVFSWLLLLLIFWVGAGQPASIKLEERNWRRVHGRGQQRTTHPLHAEARLGDPLPNVVPKSNLLELEYAHFIMLFTEESHSLECCTCNTFFTSSAGYKPSIMEIDEMNGWMIVLFCAMIRLHLNDRKSFSVVVRFGYKTMWDGWI